MKTSTSQFLYIGESNSILRTIGRIQSRIDEFVGIIETRSRTTSSLKGKCMVGYICLDVEGIEWKDPDISIGLTDHDVGVR